MKEDQELRERVALRWQNHPSSSFQVFTIVLFRACEVRAQSIECTPAGPGELLLKIGDHAKADELQTQLREDLPASWFVQVA